MNEKQIQITKDYSFIIIIVRISNSISLPQQFRHATEIHCILFNSAGNPKEVITCSLDNDRNSKKYPQFIKAKIIDKKEYNEFYISIDINQIFDTVVAVGFVANICPTLIDFTNLHINMREKLNINTCKLYDFEISCACSKTPFANIQQNAVWHYKNYKFQSLDEYSIPDDKKFKNINGSVKIQKAVIICKIYNNKGLWNMSSIYKIETLNNPSIGAIISHMQLHLLDIFPSMEVQTTNNLASIKGICNALNSSEFWTIGSSFPKGGVKKDEFVKTIFNLLLSSHYNEISSQQIKASNLVSLLYEMFEQIDINGDTKVDWDEFTSFCVSVGMSSTDQSQTQHGNTGDIIYVPSKCSKQRKSQKKISKIRYYKVLRKAIIIEENSRIAYIHNTQGELIQETNFTVHKLEQAKNDISIIDIEHIPGRNVLAIATSDRIVSFWQVVTSSDNFVYLSSVAVKETQLYLKYHKKLFGGCLISTSLRATFLVWNTDDFSNTIFDVKTGHSDRITDCVDIPEMKLFATSSCDKTIVFWDTSTKQLQWIFRGHKQGIKCLDHVKNLVLSGGFDNEVRCWYISAKASYVILGGHQSSICGLCVLNNALYTDDGVYCMTADISGKVILWDLSRCNGTLNDYAAKILAFNIASEITGFVITPCTINNENNVIKEISGNLLLSQAPSWLPLVLCGKREMLRFIPCLHGSESAPVKNLMYNTVARTFCGDIDGVINVWDALTGCKIQDTIRVSDVEINSIAYDLPRERKLFLGTSDGYLRMYNPITGSLMHKCQIHDGRIIKIIYCQVTATIVSLGVDNVIYITHDHLGEAFLEPLRNVQQCHGNDQATTLAYSHELALIATGDDSGKVHLWDFVTLFHKSACTTPANGDSICQLVFMSLFNCLIAGYDSGHIRIWSISFYGSQDPTSIALLMPSAPVQGNGVRFVSCISSLCFICQLKPSAEADLLEEDFLSKCIILSGDEIGGINLWNLNYIKEICIKCSNVQRQRLYLELFKPMESSALPISKLSYTPHLKLERRGIIEAPNITRRKQPLKYGDNSSSGSEINIPAKIYSENAHRLSVIGIQSVGRDHKYFLSSSMDTSIKLWDFSFKLHGVLEAKAEKKDSQDLTKQFWNFVTPANNIITAEHEKIASILIQSYNSTKMQETLHNKSLETVLSVNENLQNHINDRPLVSLDHSKYAVTEKHSGNMTVKAFSEKSINTGVKSGLYGTEESTLLLQVGRSHQALLSFDNIEESPVSNDEIESAMKTRFPKGADKYNPILMRNEYYLNEIGRCGDQKISPVILDRNKININDKTNNNKQDRLSHIERKIPTHVPVTLSKSISEGSLDYLKLLDKHSLHSSKITTIEDTENIVGLNSLSKKIMLSREIYDELNQQKDEKHSTAKAVFIRTSYEEAESPRKKANTKSRKNSVIKSSFFKNSSQRKLTPLYIQREIMDVVETLLRFDIDTSGDINMKEWSNMISKYSEKTTPLSCVTTERLFYFIDRNSDGHLSVTEILSVLYPQVSREELINIQNMVKVQHETSGKS